MGLSSGRAPRSDRGSRHHQGDSAFLCRIHEKGRDESLGIQRPGNRRRSRGFAPGPWRAADQPAGDQLRHPPGAGGDSPARAADPWRRADGSGRPRPHLEAAADDPAGTGDAVGQPWVRGERYFYARRRAEQDLAAIAVRVGAGGEEVLIDPAAMSADRSKSVRILDLSDDGRLLVYAEQEGGQDEVQVRLFDVDIHQALADQLPKGRYFGVALLSDNRGMYYARESAPGESARLFFHRLGTTRADDREIFGEGYPPGTIVWGNLSDDGRYLVVHALTGTPQRVEVYVQKLTMGGEFLEVVSGIDATFYGGVLGDKLVLHTNWQAPRWRVLVTDPDNPGRDAWREIIPEHEKAVIETVFGAGGRLFVEYLEDVHSRLAVFDLEGRELGDVPFPALGSLGGIRGQWDQNEVFLTFSSFHIPPTVYRYDVRTRELTPWHRPAAAIDPERFEMRQIWYPSQDGTRVPMFMIHPRELKRDGSNPTLLTGYGGFGTSLAPSFNQEAVAWLRRGGVYAIANVRGGGELGEVWHQAAVREKKQNSIADFIGAAEWLIAQGYTRPEKLATTGHSNGGLLVAAAMTQRPELFRAVICSHALVDMVRYNKFLAGRFWLPEYGSPDQPDGFEYLYSYSPYHRLEPNKEYPAVLFITAANDTRVAPLHVMKMTARMQALANPQRPVILRYHKGAGHSGQGFPVNQRIDELTDSLSFLFWQLGEL
ncbi:MAG: S9 family peptidase [bacterium]|nr:S9 family peptidase [bacterium]